MKNLVILFFLIPFSVFAINAQKESDSMVEIHYDIVKILKDNPNTLVVYDIDNTLLRTKEAIGSDQWFTWKSDQILKENPDLYGDLIEWYGLLINHSEMVLTEPDLPKIFATQQRGSFPIIALTSRGPQLREATERELKNNNLSFKPRAIGKGIPGKFIPSGFKRELSYSNGIILSAGQHKGEVLLYFLKRYKVHNKITQIVFIDDHSKNTNRVYETFSKTPIDVVTYRYSREDENVQRFHNSPGMKADTTKKLNLFRETLKTIFKRVPRKI